jgi:hypothetical protein
MRVVRGGFRVGVTLFAGLALALLSGGTVFSCGGSSSGAGVSGNCSINSDCDNPLICAFGRCHNACADSRDCPTNERCVASVGGGVCQLSQESTCSAAMLCQTGEVCGGDGQCRAACGPSLPCLTGDYCLTSSAAPAACYSPSDPVDVAALVAAGVLGGDGAVLTDGSGGVIPGDGSMGGGDGPGDSNEGGGSNDANGGPDVPVNTCPSAQTQFGNTAQGDANASFTSGVGVRTASALLIFSSYVGPDPDAGAPIDGGDAGTVNLVYVQAFDLSANPMGAPQPVFTAPAGDGFVLESASIAPTGQIALTFNYGNTFHYQVGNTAGQLALYAAFLAPSADAGAAAVALVKTVELESGEITGQPHVIWSVATGAFVFSWQYTNLLGTRNFTPSGQAAGGTDPVPTDNTSASVYTNGQRDIGSAASASSFGVAFQNTASNFPDLTVLDLTGAPIGNAVTVAATGVGYWVTVAASAQGFIYIYDNASAVSEVFLPTSGDAGVLLPPDGGDAGLAGFTFTGAVHAYDAHAINDDTGGPGGVGVALLYATEVSFAYINADGLTHLGPSSVLPHTYVDGDLMNITNFDGSFGVSLYSATDHSTQLAASGCVTP